jgi:hypothetical protein
VLIKNLIATTTQAAPANATTDAPTRAVPTRKLSIDPQTAETLDRRLAQRPDKHDLVERNILKGMLPSPVDGRPGIDLIVILP